MATTTSAGAPAADSPDDDLDGFCEVRRWYIHLAASAIAFLGGLLLLLAWRAVLALHHCLKRRHLLISAHERRIFASETQLTTTAAMTTMPDGGHQRSLHDHCDCDSPIRDLAGRIVSPHTATGRVALVLNFCLSMASVAFYSYEAATWTGRVEHCFPWGQSPLRIIDLSFNCFYLIRFCLHFLAAQDKLRFWLELHSIVDFCTVPSAFVSVYLEQYWLGLRSIRALHIMSLPDVLQQISVVRSGSVIRLLQLITIFSCVWFLGASATHVLENSGDPFSDYTDASAVSFGDCLFFTIVTMSTVGFGDVTPRTDWGRTFVSMYILVALSIFASFIPEIAGMVNSRSKYAGSYAPQHGKKHIVVCGTITRQSLDTFLANLLHPDRQMSNSLEVVCVSPQKPDEEFQGLLKKFFRNLTYLEGTILCTTDCRRASLPSAEAAIILASQYSANPDDEDAENTMRAVSIKNVAPQVRCIVQLLGHHNKRRLECVPHWRWHLGDECVCSSELRLGLLAQSCVAPGFSTLMANLFATRSMPTSGEAWQFDYHKGSANEIYSDVFGPAFYGMSFAEAAAVCFTELSIILVAVMTDDSADDPAAEVVEPQLLVNPSDRGEGFVISATGGCRGFFFAGSQEEVQQILTLDVETAREAARRGRSTDGGVAEAASSKPTEPLMMSLDASGTTHWCPARSLDDGALLPIDNQGHHRHRFRGHYILCVIGGSTTASQSIGLSGFVAPLRSRAYHRCDLARIVIVCEMQRIRLEWRELRNFPEVHVVPGSPMSRASLRAAGIDQCDMCVVISGNSWRVAERADPYLVDREVVMCTLNIRAMDQPGGSDLYYRVLGMQSPESHQQQRQQQQPQPRLGTPTLTEIFVDKNIQYLGHGDGGEEESAFEEIQNTEAFASGSAFTESVLDSLLATVYYNSSAMRLIRALVTGGAAHQRLDADEVADDGGEDCEGAAASGSAASGTAAPPEAMAVPVSRVAQLTMTDNRLAPYGCSTFGHLFLGLLASHGILCFGVYRYKASYGGGGGGSGVGSDDRGFCNRRIVIACPPADFQMLRSDAIYCLLPARSLPADGT